MNGSATFKASNDTYFIKPGLHSHNEGRRLDPHPSRHRIVAATSGFLFLLGLCGMAYYAYTLADQYIYQAYENWAFDQHIAGRQVRFADYVRERTPFGFLTGAGTSAPVAVKTESTGPANAQPSSFLRPGEGSVLGRVQVDRLNLSAIVREGVTDATLSRAVGHLPYTALPGQTGNFAIAAHRDTLFRALKDIQKDDRVTFQSPTGSCTYRVVSTKIVRPSDLSVVQPHGTDKLLTMITCYPFYYVGSAPKRFIVQARLIENNLGSEGTAEITSPAHPKGANRASVNEPRRTRRSSVLSGPRITHASRSAKASVTRHKKRSLWHKLVHKNHT